MKKTMKQGSILCLLCLFVSSEILNVIAHPQIIQTMEWKFSRKLDDYRRYGAITLERVAIPLHTITANITLNAYSTSGSCPVKNVKVFAKQFGIPVVSRDNETFPDDTVVPVETHNVTVETNNQTNVWIIQELQEGSLFIMSILPNPDTRIRQKGLSGECSYFITIQVKMLHYEESSVTMVPVNEEYLLKGTSTTIAGFRLPLETQSYILEIQGCRDPCPVSALVSKSPVLASNKTDCVWKNNSCAIQVNPAQVNSVNYLTLSSSSQDGYAFKLKVQVNTCQKVDLTNTSQLDLVSNQDLPCGFSAQLNRETPSDENQGSNFFDRFAVLDTKTSLPSKLISVPVSDKYMAVKRFNLWTSDTGATLNFILHSLIIKGEQDATVNICVSPHRILNSSSCAKGSMMTVNTLKENDHAKLMFPYPESGVWYFSMHSSCFAKAANKSSNHSVPCKTSPVVNMTVSLASCVEGRCGKYGTCKLYTGANILYSACECRSGWRGYGCNDGSKALSNFDEKLAVYLLTFSNLGFIPGIVIALHRKFYVEALVYAYNMFFSTFYHACDSSYVYQLCILPYNALSFADFLASLLSFAVTLLAMSRIPTGLRSFLHMLMALFISLGEVYNRHGLVEQLLPIAVGVAILIISWIFEMYKRKALFPTKKRYFKFILPGLVLASLGLALNLSLSTQENYKFVHSVWHLLESLAIVFLLPPGKRRKGGSNTGLSIQSGDVALSGDNINLVDEQGASLRNAGDVSPISGSTSTMRQSPSLRERISRIRIFGPRRSHQNFVL